MEDHDHKRRGAAPATSAYSRKIRLAWVSPAEVGEQLAAIDTGVDQTATNRATATQLVGDFPEGRQKEQPASKGGREECRDLEIVGRWREKT